MHCSTQAPLISGDSLRGMRSFIAGTQCERRTILGDNSPSTGRSHVVRLCSPPLLTVVSLASPPWTSW